MICQHGRFQMDCWDCNNKAKASELGALKEKLRMARDVLQVSDSAILRAIKHCTQESLEQLVQARRDIESALATIGEDGCL